ncbi:MAG: RNA polymerase sigma-54 factor [Euryarchaeota archaeon]|nr:RNA polymerase sigma-54 factor [Euryarchaeota archaeon]|tara:strand:+ start:895 stop:2355 length:1461 start_codon:yes stop_codon:yes gene_type:complete
MLKQSLQQKQLQRLSPQQIQLMKLLQVPTVELEARIKQELEANPALEEGVEREEQDDLLDGQEDERDDALEEFDFDEYLDDDTPDYKTSIRNHGADVEDKDIPLGAGSTFREQMISQLGLQHLDDHERMLGEHLIGQLDEAGYLRRDLESIVNDLAFTQNMIVERVDLERVLRVIQTLDPAGVGATSLQECLLIQINRKRDGIEDRVRAASMVLASDILENHYDAFTKKHYSQIISKLEIEEEVLKYALDEITKLNPKPGNSGGDSSRPVQHVVPDFILRIRDEEVVVTLNQRNAPELRISPQYKEMMDTYSSGAKTSKEQKEALTFVKQKVDAAKWFVDAIRQRQLTLMKTINAIVKHQEAYFTSGDETDIKPMILKDIAEKIEMDISTISRVANSKYVQTPYGTFLLKTFFSESLSTDSGEDVSSREVKRILQDAINEEDKKKPLTDEKLGKILNEKGYHIARRTVAKYREQLGIPVARLRKEL